MSDPQPIKAGSDSRRNWKTINQVIEQQSTLHNQNSERARGIAELRKRPRDMGGGGNLELTDCSTGLTYRVIGTLVPPA